MRSKLCIALVVLVLMLTGAPVQRHIAGERDRLRLRVGVEGLAPDEIFTTMCLAGFRGVAVDYLWVKAFNLQLDHKWHEVRAVTELIAKLQPHFPTVWVFNSWNLAYNISVEWVDPGDQWKWIKDGLAYLDQGLQRNPDSIQIFFEKGWIYWHKINLGPSEGPEDYFRERLLEDQELNPRGLTAYELAADWFLLAQRVARTYDDDPDRQHPFLSKGQVEAMYYKALQARAEELRKEGDIEGACELLTRVLQELEILLRRNGQNFSYIDRFEPEYRAVTQELWRLRIIRDMATGL
ncbi:MAG: hypothetical protein KAX80_08595 [Planctomycetes bacterium]|nr:hypothetical protein [Planctomycetota bacterium]